MKTQSDEVLRNLNIRIPESVLRALRERAKDNQRSLNSEIVYTLQQSLKNQKEK